MDRTILAISGGGFSEEDQAYIDEYLLKIPRKQEPLKIAFIATASNDAQGYIDKFYKAFKNEQSSHLTINDFDSPHIQEIVNDLDIVYVGGGNTQYMLEIWKKTGFDVVLRNAYQKGVILAGISAGSMCWFETCFSEKNEEEFEEFEGLGLLKGSLCPHYNDKERRIAFDHWASTQKNSTLYTLLDNENLHFKNEKLVAKIIT
ncbi:peptidase E [Paenibacillus cineris]|uniref:Type 1 glutamine amidotransferase-like domain-containing protein n=1 Tax=Paenibacillus cineris TaxID=237530 RepID=UPI001B0F5F4B|nr:peptidase E [Paenibacillus cineris]GIO64003.1 putative peptidase YgaJ [Paenibacillus cineris]